MSVINNYIRGVNECLGELSEQSIDGIAETIFTANKNNKQVVIMGNGGSVSSYKTYLG
jgi:phosphoheptose isomerase